MELKTIEEFSTTRDAAQCRKHIEARVEGGQRLQTPAPFIRKPVSPQTTHTAGMTSA